MRTLNTNLKDYFLLLVLTLIIYWPLSLNLLSLKNDALIQYLAYRYHLSEAIQNGHMPFWSPYLYTGFPIHADIQGMVWNPVVLLLSFISKYNMTVLQWEVLIYLYIAAIGMFRLIRFFDLTRVTAICCAVAFICCGYMTDSVSVIPWIPSAGFIPIVLLYFLKLIRFASITNVIKFSFSLALMFLCGYPSFFIFLNYILIISFVIWFINKLKEKNKTVALKTSGSLAIAYLLFLLIVSPAIISFYEFLPYYSRGSGLSYTRAASNPLVPFSLISYLLANAANKANFLATDLSMKNTYIGLLVFFFFLISLTRLDAPKKIILGFTVFSFLYSLGDLVPVQKFSYHFLPLMDTFRHPGTIRIFTCIGMIWLAAFSMEEFFVSDKKQILKRLNYVTLGILLIAAIYLLTTDSYKNIIPFSFHPSVLKELLYTLSFKQFAASIAVLQILFLIAFIFLLEGRLLSVKAAKVLIILNSVVFAWIGLPFNVVSQNRTADVNAYINSFPDGYPMPDVHGSIESEVNSDSIEISVHGYHNFYNKKITIQDKIITPTLNSDYEMFLGDFPLRRQLKGYPFVYLTDSLQQRIDSADIKLVHLTPNSFAFAVRINQSAEMHLFQQYNHNWHVTINKRPAEIRKSNIAFMKVQLPATSGSLIIKWEYCPKNVYSGIIISLVTLLAIILYFVFRRKLKTKYA